MTYYRTTNYTWEVKPVEVISTTSKTITLKPERPGERVCRTSQKSSYYSYWETEKEAYAHLRERAESKIANARQTIEEMEAALEQLALAELV